MIGVSARNGGAITLEEAFAPGGWSFGHVPYDHKNELEALTSRHPSTDGFGSASWWRPDLVVVLQGQRAEVFGPTSARASAEKLLRGMIGPIGPDRPTRSVAWQRTTSQEHYLHQVQHLLEHIQRGDIYEVNYCTERHAHLPDLDPLEAFGRLVRATAAPFAGIYRSGDRYALCASPERYLAWEGEQVVSQPMKGTRPRSADPEEDRARARQLAEDPKERSENIMALDVARHDLARVAASGSVRVEELCAVRSYPAVHQMISTVAAVKRADITWRQVVEATFPMASMTGAPKLRAMQLIDEVEDMRRGLFSGTLGFHAPDGTADLNVVIRTLTYDALTGRASLISGGAITAASDPMAEWEECELKAMSVLKALGHVG